MKVVILVAIKVRLPRFQIMHSKRYILFPSNVTNISGMKNALLVQVGIVDSDTMKYP